MNRRFDLDLLAAFVAACDEGSLTRAADAVGRSQSAVSEQIRKLEAFCGAPLLARGKSGAKPTPAGERLLLHARKMLAASEAAFNEMAGREAVGDFRLAVTDYFRPNDIARLLRRLRDRHPRLRLHVFVLKSARIESGEQAFDLGVSMRVAADETFGEGAGETGRRASDAVLAREPLVWAAAPQLADEAAHADAAPALPILALPATCSLHRFMLARLEQAGTRHYLAHSASGVGGLQSAISAGLGYACLNRSALPPDATICDAGGRLPSLPDVEFLLRNPETAAPDAAGVVRAALREILAAPERAP